MNYFERHISSLMLLTSVIVVLSQLCIYTVMSSVPVYTANCVSPAVKVKVHTSYVTAQGWGEADVCQWYNTWRNDTTAYTNPIPIDYIQLSGTALPDLKHLTFFADTLTYLDLNNNGISTLTCGLLQGLPVLETLIVTNNLLTTVPGVCLGNITMTSLIRLDVSGNMINMVTAESLQGLENLVSVKLSGNDNIGPVLSDIIQKLPQTLTDFQCSSCNLQDEHIQAFSVTNLPNLKTIALKSNTLTTFPNFTSASAANIEELELFQNRISELPTNYLEPFPNMKYLGLAQNEISVLQGAVDGNSSATHDNMRFLKLQYNDLDHLSLESLQGMPYLQELVLTDTGISTIGNISGYFYNLELKIKGLPLVCDSRLAWMKDGSFSGELTIEVYPCAEPAELAAVAWADITLDMLLAITTPDGMQDTTSAPTQNEMPNTTPYTTEQSFTGIDTNTDGIQDTTSATTLNEMHATTPYTIGPSVTGIDTNTDGMQDTTSAPTLNEMQDTITSHTTERLDGTSDISTVGMQDTTLNEIHTTVNHVMETAPHSTQSAVSIYSKTDGIDETTSTGEIIDTTTDETTTSAISESMKVETTGPPTTTYHAQDTVIAENTLEMTVSFQDQQTSTRTRVPDTTHSTASKVKDTTVADTTSGTNEEITIHGNLQETTVNNAVEFTAVSGTIQDTSISQPVTSHDHVSISILTNEPPPTTANLQTTQYDNAHSTEYAGLTITNGAISIPSASDTSDEVSSISTKTSRNSETTSVSYLYGSSVSQSNLEPIIQHSSNTNSDQKSTIISVLNNTTHTYPPQTNHQITETNMIRRNYTRRTANTLVANAISTMNKNSPTGDTLKALKLYYATPVEAPAAVYIGTMAVVFLCAEMTLVLLSDVPYLFQAVNRLRNIVGGNSYTLS